jgi:hypothetical protein
MQLYFERSGGFMGLHLQAAVDTADLPSEEAEEWQQALAAADFFNLPSNLEKESGTDAFLYKLTVVTAEKKHTALCTDENMPEELRPLLRRLTIMAR